MSSRRGFLAAAGGTMLAAPLLGACAAQDHSEHSPGAVETSGGHGPMSGVLGATFRSGGRVDHAANGFDPGYCCATSTTATPRSEPTGGRCVSGRSSPRTGRSRSRRAFGSRRGRSTAGSPDRRCDALRAISCACGSSTAPSTRTPCISTASMPPRWTACRWSAAGSSPRRGVHVHLRRRTLRTASLPLPRWALG